MERAILALDAAVRSTGLPFVVEPVLWTSRRGGSRDPKRPWKRGDVSLVPRVAVKVFRVVRLRRLARNGEYLTAAWVERLDRLNIGESHLGRSRRESPYALVLYDEAREYARSLLPAMGAAARLGGGWHGLGPSLEAPILALVRAGLGGATDEVTVSLAVARSTERHELEHESDRTDAVPSVLFRRMAAYTDGSIRRTARELRAYPAQMAGSGSYAAVVLAKVLRTAASDAARGTKESFAAKVIVDGFAAELGIPEEAQRARVRLVAERMASEPARVPEVAARVYEDLFGDAPAVFQLVEDREGPR
jgi:hypothetical protein